jgi:hypothetical protein
MVKKALTFIGILFCMASFFSGCGTSREKEMGDRELVRINEVPISLEEFEQFSEGQSLEGKMRVEGG